MSPVQMNLNEGLLMQSLVVIQQVLHDRLLAARTFQRLVTSPIFERLYKGAGEDDQNELLGYVRTGNKEAVETWIESQQTKQEDASALSMRELRRKASQLGIAGYGWMSKPSLLSAIHNKMKEASNATGTTGTRQTAC